MIMNRIFISLLIMLAIIIECAPENQSRTKFMNDTAVIENMEIDK